MEQTYASTIEDEIIRETNNELKGITRELETIGEITKDISTLVHEQKEDLNHIEHNVESSKVHVEEGKKRIVMAAHYDTERIAKKGGAIGAAVGGVILAGVGLLGGPLGVAVGAGGGAVTGGALGYKIGKKIGRLKNSEVEKEVFESHLKDKWEEDDKVTHCNYCKREFSTIRRKHHCRQCGKIFCNACCSKTKNFKLPEMYEEAEQRICLNCHVK